MFKRIRKQMTTKQILHIVNLLKRTRRFLTVVAVLAMLLSYLPWQMIEAQTIEENTLTVSTQDTEENMIPPTNYYENDKLDIGLVPVVTEDVSMRTANEKYFRKLDGTYEVAIYDNVVHYLVDGEWVQIDNSLNDLGNELENSKNKFKIKFPKTIDSNKKIKLSMDDYKIDWSILDISSSSAKYGNDEPLSNNIKELNDINQLITYSQIQNGVDVEYLLSGDNVKEFIVLESYIPDFNMTFEYELKNLSLIENGDGIIVFVDDNNKEVFEFEELFMYDAELSKSYAVDYTMEEVGNKTYQITITPSDEWLQNAVYPVKIDPTLKSSSTSLGIYDTYISEANPDTKYYNSQYMYLSNTYSSAEYRGLLYFSIPSTLMDQVITYAHLSFTEYSTVNGSQMNIYKNTEAFSSGSATWNNAPSYDPSVIDYHVIKEGSPMIFDVTEAVKEWQSDSIRVTHGFTIAKDENYGNVNIVYQNGASTSLRPVVTIGYEEPSGLKDYWTYTSQDMGKVGTGYISDYTGNLTWVRNEYSLDNEYMSLSLSFFHNNYRRNIDVGYGDGWRTNYSIEVLKDQTNGLYYIHKPDGNEIHFMNETCEIIYTNTKKCTSIAEDGSRMLLERFTYLEETYNMTITTISDLEYTFNENGRLTKIRNTKTNHDLIITYLTSQHIDNVSDETGNRIQFFYNSSSKLSRTELQLKQTNGEMRWVEKNSYIYDGDSIDYISRTYNYGTGLNDMYSHSEKLQYNFDDNNNLIEAYAEKDLYKVEYGYAQNRVVNVITSDEDEMADKLLIGDLSIGYDHGKTTYTDYEGDSIYYLFDHYGHTINIMDDFGNSAYYRYSGLFTNLDDLEDPLNGFDLVNLYPNYYNNHNLIESSDVLKQHQNSINNHGFEESIYGWDLYEGTGGISYSSTESLLGSKSMEIYRSSSSVYAYQSIYLEKGSYTVEGWIKNSGGSPGAYIDVLNTSLKATIDKIFNTSEWTKYQLEFSISTSRYVGIKLINDTNYSTAYFDNVQLHEGFVDTRYNPILNNSFESGNSDWTTSGAYVNSINETGIMEEILGEKAIRIFGDGATRKSFSQNISGLWTKDETYIVGGWAKADAVPNKGYVDGYEKSDNRFFGLIVSIYCVPDGTDGVTTPYHMDLYLPFNTAIEGWQYQMMSFEVPRIAADIDIIGVYQGEGVAYFDNIQLYHDNLSTHYDYSSTTGNLMNITDPSGSTTTMEYDSENNVTSVTIDGQTITLNRNGTHQIEEISKNNVRTTFIYDSTGKQLTDTIVGEQTIDDFWFGTSTTYTNDWQYINSVTDEFGNSSSSTTDYSVGLITEIMDAMGNTQIFDYDAYGNLDSTTATDAETLNSITSSYDYDNQGRLVEILRDEYSYEFIYNDLDQITEVKIASVPVMQYEYWQEVEGEDTYYTDKLKKQTYGNGDYVEFTYTEENLVKTISFNGTTRYEYDYDSSGRLAILKDIHNNNIYFYSYDLAGRIKKVTDKDGNEITYSYDESGNVERYDYSISGITRGVIYKYEHASGEYDFTQYTVGSTSIKKDFNYDEDSLRRLDSIDLVIGLFTLTKDFNYDDSKVVYGNATNRIYKIDYFYGQTSNPIRYYYEYDENHNIKEIKVSDHDDIVLDQYNYHYDGFNQLIREDIKINQTNEKSVKYVYDNQGNITGIYEFAYTNPISSITSSPTSQKVISYENTWGDQITQISYYNSVTLSHTETYSYDDSGNLLKIDDSRYYYDDTFQWDGRQLTSFGSYCFSYGYKYNDQGIRTEKKYESCGGSLSIDYTLDGDKVLVEERSDGTTLHFTYDVDGSLLSMNYNGNEYFYVTNIQGDIIELLDIDGTVVVEYKYDAWGNLTYKTDNALADINPYRYRGYRFDEETGWYYLQSRYYNPQIGRFISSDGLVGSKGNIQGHNMYAYTQNNPVMDIDPNGESALLALITALAVLLLTGCSDNNLNKPNDDNFHANIPRNPNSTNDIRVLNERDEDGNLDLSKIKEELWAIAHYDAKKIYQSSKSQDLLDALGRIDFAISLTSSETFSQYTIHQAMSLLNYGVTAYSAANAAYLHNKGTPGYGIHAQIVSYYPNHMTELYEYYQYAFDYWIWRYFYE